MLSDVKITKFYCMADGFCKEIALQQEKYNTYPPGLFKHCKNRPGLDKDTC